MSKPDWKDAPEWAMWLAQDEDGYWNWWESEPKCKYHELPWWMPSPEGMRSKNAGIRSASENWIETLESRP